MIDVLLGGSVVIATEFVVGSIFVWLTFRRDPQQAKKDRDARIDGAISDIKFVRGRIENAELEAWVKPRNKR